MGDILGVAKIKNMGMLENPDIFGDERQMLGPSRRMKKK